MVNGYFQSNKVLSLVIRGVFYENCSYPSYLEVGGPDSVFIPIFVEPAYVEPA